MNVVNGRNFDINVKFPEVKFRVLLAVLGVTFGIGGIFSWIYVFLVASEVCKSVLVIELIANGIMLLVNLYGIMRIGYHDNFWRNVGLTFSATLVLSIIGFYLGNIQILAPVSEASAMVLVEIMRFFIYLIIAAFMAFVPALINCLLMRGIMHLFGTRND